MLLRDELNDPCMERGSFSRPGLEAFSGNKISPFSGSLPHRCVLAFTRYGSFAENDVLLTWVLETVLPPLGGYGNIHLGFSVRVQQLVFSRLR